MSGCLLFTDPINKAPTVTMDPHTGPVTRGSPAYYTAGVTDDKDNPASLLLEWSEFLAPQLGCGTITLANWGSNYTSTTLGAFEPYPFKPANLAKVCLCARTTDHNGATGFDCTKTAIAPVNAPPVAVIEDVSGARSNQPRPLCSQVHLSAEGSTFTLGDQFNWTLQYTGTDSAGKSVQLSPCTGVVDSKKDQHRCFYAAAPGGYAVTLQIVDSAVLNGATISTPSNLVTFAISVNADTPPCLQRTDPDVYAGRILLSLGTNLDVTYQSRTFKVLSVADDCEPFPLPAGSTGAPTKFHWSVLDNTQASPAWTSQTNATESFTVSQSMFPNARPGDTIGLRVEVRDTLVQNLYPKSGPPCLTDTVDICCGAVACGTPNDCVRWTTWTVQFEP
jgi:hypothetical protein